jgi:hypothetical protein
MMSLSRFNQVPILLNQTARALTTTSVQLSSDEKPSKSWLNKLLSRKITKSEASKEAHSSMLSDKEVVYALHTHNVRADSVDKYLKNYKNTVEMIQSKKEISCELVGSWQVQVGDADQCLHLWRYVGGFEKIDLAYKGLYRDEDYVKLATERGNYLRARHLQYLLAFTYWPEMVMRKKDHIYEMRSYRLKPGTMIEWGNNWARAINFRQSKNEAFAGFFSQIGRLYNVHHIWCYKSYQERKETREQAWRQPGWDECVAYTVPLIREMHCRILVPTEFSPTK